MTISANDLWWIIPLIIWEFVWKGLALWRSARLKQTEWFIALLVINSAGLLPIAYLLTHKGK